MTENFANTYQTTLAADLTAVATTLTVASATGAPAPQFRLLIDAEIVLVTAVAGVTYSVTRGVEGTTAASHTASSVVSHVVTAGALDQLRADAPHVIQDEGVALAARPALNVVGEHVAATDDAAGNRTNVTVNVPDATTTAHGLLRAADKAKLDGIAAGAQVNVLESVTGTAPIVAGVISGKIQAVSISAASGSAAGSMSPADFSKLAGYPATPGLDGHTIQDEGTALAQRAGLNFVGPALTVTDDSAGNRSVVTLPTASATVEGSLSAAGFGKLDGVETGAQVNVLEGIDATAPVTVSAIAAKRQTVGIVAASGSAAGSMSAEDFSKLAGYPANPLTVREADSAPSVAAVSTLVVANDTLTDNGAGTATLVTGQMRFIGESSSAADLTEATATSGWRTAWGDALTTPMEVAITSTGTTDRFLLLVYARMIFTAAPGVNYLGYRIGTGADTVQSGNDAGVDKGLLGARSISGLAAGSYTVQLRFYTQNAVTARLLDRYVQIFQVR